ncbi:MAG: hypothetical protein NZ534_05685, partial [Bacteroidia bacterium]|nr:hypothetical protein [Bacteroidia bacterium]
FSAVVKKVAHLGRTFFLNADAVIGTPSFGADLVFASDASLLIFVFLLTVGWAALSAAASHVSGPYAYVFYFAFCVAIYQSETARWISGSIGDWREKGAALGLMLPYLIFAYLFRSRTWVKGLTFQFFFWTAWMGLWFGVQWALGGLPALHRAAAYPMVAYVLLLILTALFVSKDLMHAVILALNHVPDPRRRRSAGVVFGACLLIVLGLLFAYLHAYLLLPHGQNYALRALWFFVFAAGFSFWLSQNFYPPFQRYFSSPLGFAMLIVGGTTIAVAAWAYYAAAGEALYVREAERLVATVFLTAAVVQFFYLLRNHGADIQKRKPVYFALPTSKTNFIFASVWFAAVAVLIVQSGRQNWHNFYGFYVSMLNQYADEAWRKGEADQALLWYEQAAEHNLADPKSNHNWAVIAAQIPESLENAETLQAIDRRFAEADRINDFPYAAMARGNFLRLTFRQREATATLKKAALRRDDHRLYCNLAAAYLGVEKRDSARWALERAWDLAPREATVSAAWAAFYLSADSLDAAWEHARRAFERAPKLSVAAQNYCAVALARDTLADLSPFSEGDTAVLSPSAAYNVALAAIRAQNETLAEALLRPLTQNADPDVHYAYFLARLPSDEPAETASRRTWLTHQFADLAPALNRAMALRCFEKDAPECAAEFFRAAGEPQDRFFAALMDLEAGDDFRAYDTLMALAAEYPDLQSACRREMALLEAAHQTGQEKLLWDFADMTRDEALRIGRYAARIGRIEFARRIYDSLARADDRTVAPMLELGRLHLTNADAPRAVETLLSGLKRDGENRAILYELARAYHYAGRKRSADSLLERLDDPRLRLELKPEPRAIIEYAFKYPWDTFAVRRAVRFLVKNDSVETGLKLMHKVLDFNRRRAEWWNHYGYFNEKTGFLEEAEFAFEQAWQCEFRDSLKTRYFKEYERLRKMRAT